MATLNDFNTFFKNIAINHVSIRHTEQEKHFCSMEAEEVLSGMKQGVHFRLLVLETYEFGFSDKDSDNVSKNRICGLMLLDLPKNKEDFTERTALMSDIEETVDEILRMMVKKRNHPYNNPVLKDFDINTVNVIPLMNGPDGSCGFRIVFDSKGWFHPAVDDSKWISTDF